MNVLSNIDEAISYFEQRADAEYSPDVAPPHGNEEMKLMCEMEEFRDAVVALVNQARMAASTLEGCAVDLAADCGHRELLAALKPFGG